MAHDLILNMHRSKVLVTTIPNIGVPSSPVWGSQGASPSFFSLWVLLTLRTFGAEATKFWILPSERDRERNRETKTQETEREERRREKGGRGREREGVRERERENSPHFTDYKGKEGTAPNRQNKSLAYSFNSCLGPWSYLSSLKLGYINMFWKHQEVMDCA